MERNSSTWDGQPIAEEPPYGATVVVYRAAQTGMQFLLLHRAHRGPDYEGEWAWTPPAGARRPGEPVEACAERELHEESGLTSPITVVDVGEDWAVFCAEVESDAAVVLHDDEHDRFEWVPLDVVASRCRPKRVADAVKVVAATIGT